MTKAYQRIQGWWSTESDFINIIMLLYPRSDRPCCRLISTPQSCALMSWMEWPSWWSCPSEVMRAGPSGVIKVRQTLTAMVGVEGEEITIINSLRAGRAFVGSDQITRTSQDIWDVCAHVGFLCLCRYRCTSDYLPFKSAGTKEVFFFSCISTLTLFSETNMQA